MIKLNERKINEAWNVGEPSNFSRNGRSYWDNPKDWKDKLAKVEKALKPYEKYLALGSHSPWTCYIDERRPKGQLWPHVYQFDYWEDKMPFDTQLKAFDKIAKEIVKKNK